MKLNKSHLKWDVVVGSLPSVVLGLLRVYSLEWWRPSSTGSGRGSKSDTELTNSLSRCASSASKATDKAMSSWCGT